MLTQGFSPKTNSIIKLNGSCLNDKIYHEISDDRKNGVITNFLSQRRLNQGNIGLFVSLFKALSRTELDYFNFAWENRGENNSCISNAIEILKSTDILVIVGYSFPYYNMHIDSVLLKSLKHKATIYVQDYKDRLPTVIDRMKYFKFGEHQIKDVNQTDLFFVPPEYFSGITRDWVM